MEALRASKQLFKSNLFRLQMTELLSEAKVDMNKTGATKSALYALRQTILDLDAIHTSVPFSSVFPSLSTVAPDVESLFGSEIEVDSTSHPVEDVVVIGSFLAGTVAFPELNVDLGLVIDPSSFQTKDYINGRYMGWRNAYMVAFRKALKRALKKKGGNARFRKAKVSLTGFAGDSNKPIVTVSGIGPDTDLVPGKKVGTPFVVRIYPMLDSRDGEGGFEVRKLAPGRNNLRKPQFGSVPTPTPVTNAAILEDMLMPGMLEMIHAAVNDPGTGDAVRDAIILAKVWLSRQLPSSARVLGDPSGFHLTLLLIHLVGSRSVPRGTSGYLLFRALLEHLASRPGPSVLALPVDSDGWVIGLGRILRRAGVTTAVPKKEVLKQAVEVAEAAYDVVGLDPSGSYNLLWRMSGSGFADLAWLAERAVVTLDRPSLVVDVFGSLFARIPPRISRYDLVFRVHPLPALSFNDLRQGIDKGVALALASKIRTVLTTGLGPRATDVVVLPGDNEVVVGLRLVAPGSVGVVDMGPPADSGAPAEAFRAFWGERSELRRFVDGKIAEAVVWTEFEGKEEKIVPAAVKYLLKRHCGIKKKSGVGSGPVGLGPLAKYAVVGPRVDEYGRAVKGARRGLDKLTTMLQNLRTLPLSVANVRGSSAHFAGAGGNGIKTGSFGGGRSAVFTGLHVVVQFMASAAWPTDVVALQAMKAGFLIKMAEELGTFHKREVSVVLDTSGVGPNLAPVLDVMLDGFVYRVLIHHPHELRLLEGEVDRVRSAVVQGVVFEERVTEDDVRAAEQTLERVRVLQESTAAHVARLYALGTGHPALGATIVAFKSWLSAHALTGLIPEMGVEVLVAYALDQYGTGAGVVCPLPGLLRVLSFLSTHPWVLDPVVCTYGEEDVAISSVNDFHALFKKARQAGTHPMFLASVDIGVVDTSESPSVAELEALVAVAKSSAAVLAKVLALPGTEEARQYLSAVFTLQPDAFDMLVELKDPSEVKELKSSKYKNIVSCKTALVGLDPAAWLVGQLRERYGTRAVFGIGDRGRLISVRWREGRVGVEEELVPAVCFNVRVAGVGGGGVGGKKRKRGWEEGVDRVVFDMDGLFGDIQYLGGGLVKRIV